MICLFQKLGRIMGQTDQTSPGIASRTGNIIKKYWPAIVIGIGLGIFIWAGYTQNWGWTGFSGYPGMPASGMNNTLPIAAQRERTLWDWLELIVVPLSLVVVAALLRDREIHREAREKDLERQARRERYREDALQMYFRNLATLILKFNLVPTNNKPPTSSVVKLAQLQTITILRRMTDEDGTDISRINVIMAFLRDAGLLSGEAGLLIKANLSQANLQKANLSQANLQEANLSQANLQEANLSQANLQKANLSQASLQKAKLLQSRMENVQLAKANLENADLLQAVLEKANLSSAKLMSANLVNVKLQGAHLVNAILKEADLSSADLEGVNLVGANLCGAKLRNSNLRNTKISLSEAEASAVISTRFDKETVLPDGTHYVPNETDMARYTDPTHSDFWQPKWVKEKHDPENESTETLPDPTESAPPDAERPVVDQKPESP
jgi:uncharacterized protein YjbI with pentapeptide repeats